MSANSPDRTSVGFVRRLMIDTGYVLAALPITLVAFVLGITLFSLGGGLAIIWIGLPIMVLALRIAGWFGDLERSRLRQVFPSIESGQAPAPIDGGLLRPLGVGRLWRDLVFTFVAWITATVAFSVLVSFWAAALGGITYPAWQWAVPHNADDERLNELLGLGDALGVELAFHVGLGILALVLLPVVARAVALMHAGLTRAVLGPPRPPHRSPDAAAGGSG